MVCQPHVANWKTAEMWVHLPILLPGATIFCKEVLDKGTARIMLKWEWKPKFMYDLVVPLHGRNGLQIWDSYVTAKFEIEMSDQDRVEA